MGESIQNQNNQDTFFYEQPLVGVIKVSGKSHADFLQRQTTNDFRLLSSERILTTVLSSPTGRILDVLYLFEDQSGNEPAIQALTLPGNAPATTSYFNSRIFFMDQVKLLEISDNYIHIDLIGPNAGQALTWLGFDSLPETGQLLTTQADAGVIRLFQHNSQLGLGFRICATSAWQERIRSSLFEAGVKELTHNDYEILRVEAGLPSKPNELSNEYTPLEVNLESAISDEKGCYTGQEVITRQTTYDKVTRKLVGLFLSAETPVAAQLQAEGKPVGAITSAVLSSRFGPIALAIVKRPYNQPDTLLILNEGENPITARVTQLPFAP
ncbi:MAG: glycine cleavage T C-terminal barrel domain-containing protein [Anaerolineales bacterium]|jgi:tRNA-modifying protein YgfZ